MILHIIRVLPQRVGQYKVPFGRQELNSSSALQFVDRAITNNEFGNGRDRGASLNGVLGNYIAYGAGAFNGAGRNGRQENSNLLYAGRVQFMYGGKLKYSGGSFVFRRGLQDYTKLYQGCRRCAGSWSRTFDN